MEVLASTLDEVTPTEVLSFWQLFAADFTVKRTAKLIFVFFWEERWYHTDGQDVVDKLEESFFLHVTISEHESLRLLEDLSVELT